jgi:outer membrane protein assembly factor BamA
MCMVGVAQSVEHLVVAQVVGGSNPLAHPISPRIMQFRYLLIPLFSLSLFLTSCPFVSASDVTLGDRNPSGIVQAIQIENLRYTKREIILRELASRIGEPYSEDNIKKDIERLDRLGIFSGVEIHTIRDEDGVILDIQVKETIPYLPAPSLDKSDEGGFAAGVSFQAINLGGRDIEFVSSAKFGGGTHFELRTENPWFWGNHGSYRAQYYFRDRYNELDEFEEISHDFMLQMGSYIGDKGRIGGRFRLYSLSSESEGITLSPEGRDIVPTLGLYLGYDSRDFWTYPQRGWWSEFEISKSGGFLGGLSDFWSFTLDVRRYQPLIGKHSLALYSLATYRTGTVGTDVPVHQDFHIGGSNTIRGWGSNAQQGKSQFINTAEYRYLLMEPRAFSFKGINVFLGIQLAGFGDFGMAWDRADQFRLDNFIHGYGFGLRLLVPFMNVIRIDFALGEQEQGLRRHIGFDWKPEKQRQRVR